MDNNTPDLPAVDQPANEANDLERLPHQGRTRFLRRFGFEAIREYARRPPSFDKAVVTDVPGRGAGRVNGSDKRHGDRSSVHAGTELPVKTPAVTLFGDWSATTGLAEAARRMAVAMHDAGMTMSVKSVRSGAPQIDRRVPEALVELTKSSDEEPTSGRPHEIEIWMLNVNEFLGIGDEMLRPRGRRRYTVGFWFWELPTFPEVLKSQMSRVDEIWVASNFVKSSFEAATSCPVHLVPVVVPEFEGAGHGRKDFGLLDDELVFLFSFDVNSVVARKNPGAVVEAFARAFASSNENRARLVMKVLNLKARPEVDHWLRGLIESVDGVLIEDDLDQATLTDLFACADIYVSLHRSEGFGFGIAEAMALGKPVITTAYSGNVDYTDSSNSCQVGYQLREITSADHVFNAEAAGVYEVGATWAEPDVDQAAQWMRRLASDQDLRTRLGGAARETIRSRYSGPVAARAVAERLVAIASSNRPNR